MRVPFVTVPWIGAFGVRKENVLVASHGLPRGLRFDGLLGLDFFAGHKLTLDFANGLIDLA